MTREYVVLKVIFIPYLFTDLHRRFPLQIAERLCSTGFQKKTFSKLTENRKAIFTSSEFALICLGIFGFNISNDSFLSLIRSEFSTKRCV